MIKKVIKEIGIAIILLIAIALVLSIIFYKYIPNNKTVPIQVKPYTLSEEMQEELKESINQEEQNVVTTLYINDDDLDKYESKKDYNKGKANPFADYSKKEGNIANNSNTENTTNTSSNTTTSKNNTMAETNTNEVYVSTPGKN